MWALAELESIVTTVQNLRIACGLPGFCNHDKIDMQGPKGMQELYERAWAAGFDASGAADFGGKMVGKKGKEAHTGPTDMFAVLAYLGIDVRARSSNLSLHHLPDLTISHFVCRRTLSPFFRPKE